MSRDKRCVWPMPDGRYSQTFGEYLIAWDRVKEPIERLLGWERSGFDPDVAFVEGKHVSREVAWLLAELYARVPDVARLRVERTGNVLRLVETDKPSKRRKRV